MDRIKTVHIAPKIELKPIPNTYRFSEKGRFPILQRLCYWILDRLGHETAYQEIITYKTTQVNFDNLVDELFKHEDVVYQMTHNPKGYLIVGRDFQHRIYSEELNHFFHMNFPGGLNIQPRELQLVFKGYPIIFVPWIEGMFILPELK